MSISEFGTNADELAPRTDATPSVEAIDAQRAYLKSQETENVTQEASVESRMEAEIAPVVEAAKTIGPEYAQDVAAETNGFAKETLRSKIEGKVYDLLTSVEKKVGQGIVVAELKRTWEMERESANRIQKGYLSSPFWDVQGVKHEGIPRSEAQNIRSDVELAEKNLNYGRERVTFIPGGENLPRDGRSYDVKAEKPTVDLSFRSKTGLEPFSITNSYGAMRAETAIEYNPVMQTLERWRGDLGKKRQAVENTKQMIAAYNTIPVVA